MDDVKKLTSSTVDIYVTICEDNGRIGEWKILSKWSKNRALESMVYVIPRKERKAIKEE